jgi:prepilin-type N-terminal cleavage/methylation domain-containing protein
MAIINVNLPKAIPYSKQVFILIVNNQCAYSCHFERSEAESRNLLFNRFLHFGLLRNPTVEMTKAQILITFGISLYDTNKILIPHRKGGINPSRRIKAPSFPTGFTLLELLVAMTLMMVVAACLYTSLYTGFRARRSAESTVNPTITVANAIQILKQDILGAVPANGILAGAFLGVDSQDGKDSDIDSMTLYTTHIQSNTVANSAYDNKLIGGICMIELAIVKESDSENDKYQLVRRVTTNLLSPRTVEPEEQVLCRNVRSLNIQYFDGFSWLDEWDSTAHDDTLPQAINIDLQIEYEPREQSSTHKGQVRRLSQSFSIPCGVSEEEDSQYAALLTSSKI